MTVIISFKNTSSRKGSWLILYRYTAFQSCAFRVHFVCITPVFSSHATAKLQFKLLSVGNRKACISVFSSKYRLFISGGQRGIRTLDTLLTYTRVPVVRLRPAQPSVHYGASNGTWTHTSLDTRPSNVPVCLFQHTRNYSIIIHQWETIVNTRLFIFLL